MLFFSSQSYQSNSISELRRRLESKQVQHTRVMDTLSPFPNQGLRRPTGPQQWLGEAASQGDTMPPCRCLAASLLCARLPLNFRRRNHFPGQDAMAPSFCIPSWQLCQILLSPDISFLSMYPQAAKQICIE